MKKSIFTLGIALLAFTNVTFAGSTQDMTGNESTVIKNKCHAPVEDTIVTRPESIDGYIRSTEEIMAQDRIITEAVFEEAAPIACVKPIDEVIEEDNKIIESNIAFEKVYLLDFKKINRNVNFPKSSATVAFEAN